MKIVISGNYGAENIGDELILEGLLNAINFSVKDPKITVLSGNPDQTCEKFNIKAVEKFPAGIRSFFKSKTKKTRDVVKECDFFILGGGGLFGNLTFKADIIWGIQALMAYFYKKPVIMYGQSIGEIKSRIKKWIIKKIFQKASLIAVRDEFSKEQLEKIGISQKIFVMPDLALSLPYLGGQEREKKLILALRQIGNLKPEVIKIFSDYLDWMTKEKGWKISVINFQEPPSKEADKIINEKVTKSIPGIEFIPQPKTSKELFDIFSRAGLVLGMRLHSIIAAIKTKTPFLAVSYADKTENFLKDTGLLEFSINIKNIKSVDDLKKLTNSIIEASPKIQNDLSDLERKYMAEHKEMTALTLYKILSGGR